ncbi:hypothetical protein [Rhodococcus sp. W8901]|uniref:hypothetical protein n=1 Tax=Rhodococcus sp. W8901 TaxID=2742603 RepID=UPI001582DD96|nr:hypothetical protein [Rhodococcus sp. W8901]QKT13635.1 hypothetical protein HUN07_25385 [Rhodococcus sp. W8901]
MNDLPEKIEVRGTVLDRIGLAAEFVCWAADLPGDEPRTVSIVIEPAGPPTDQAVDSAAQAIAGFDVLAAAAARYLVAELADPVWELDAEDRARLDGPEAPFGLPEAIIWSDGSWMIRFAECGLAIGEEFGIGVRFTGTAPVGIEDLSGSAEVL